MSDRIRLESGVELNIDQAQRVFNRANWLQLNEGRPRVEAYRMAAKEVFPTVGGTDSLADDLAKHPAAPKQPDDHLFILSKKIEREENLSFSAAMTKASAQMEAARRAREPKPVELTDKQVSLVARRLQAEKGLSEMDALHEAHFQMTAGRFNAPTFRAVEGTCGACKWCQSGLSDGQEGLACGYNPPAVLYAPGSGVFSATPPVEEDRPGCAFYRSKVAKKAE